MTQLKAFAVAALLAASFASAAGGRGVTGRTWTDPAGDAGRAPDVTAIAISDANGLLQVQFTVSGMTARTRLFLFMDTDRNPDTGSSSGAEYGVGLSVDQDGQRRYDVTKWADSGWRELPPSASMGMSVSGDTWTFHTGTADLGSPTGFAFFVTAGLFDAQNTIVAVDRAPDSGTFTYATTTPNRPAGVVPRIGSPTIAPAPQAGKRVTVTFPVTNRSTGRRLTGGTMTCDPQIGGRVLPHTESLGNGRAKLSFTIPTTAQSKTVKVDLTIHVGAKSAHTVARFTVR